MSQMSFAPVLSGKNLEGLSYDGIPFGTYDIVTKVGAESMETLRGENLSLENKGKTWTAYAGKPKSDKVMSL